MSDPLHNHDKIEISDETRIYIIDKLVEPYYKSIINNTINGRLCWRKTGIAFETISKIMVAFGSIISFSAGFYHDETLSFVAGSISCLSLAFLQLSSFSYKENKKQSEELNILLKKLKLDTIPVFERQNDIQMRSYQPQRPSSMPFNTPYNQQPYNQQPYNSHYNPYDPYNLHDKNINYSYKESLNNDMPYVPPIRYMASMQPRIPSITKIPIRSSSIHSVNTNTRIPEEHEEEEDMLEGRPEGSPEDITKDMPEGIPEDSLEGIPEGIPEDILEGSPEGITEDITEDKKEKNIAQDDTDLIDKDKVKQHFLHKTFKYLFN